MEQTILGPAVSAIVSVVTKELIAACQSKAVEGRKVDVSLMKLYSSYKKIEAMMGLRLDNPVVSPAESQCWHDLVMCWYETEDLIDHLTLSYPIKVQDGGQLPPPRSGETSNHASRISGLQKKLDKLGLQFKDLLSAAQEPMQSSVPSRDYLGELKDKTPFVGGTKRDKDKEIIISLLTSHHHGVSIVGMDGLGKTTLARTIASDGAITSHFSPILYASVSGHFLMDNVVEKLVPSPDITGTDTGREQNDAKLIESLQGPGNALILLDDLSNVTDGVWEKFKFKYLNPHTGARILTTTRNPNVAKVTGTWLYYLDEVEDEDCTKIIKEKAYESLFIQNKVWDNDIMVISRKCMGMPLIASKFGLTLNAENTQNGFRSKILRLSKTDLWDLVEFREILPSFSLNVPELPPHLKRCFAYCSLFSPKHKFSRDELVQLWHVEGFQQRDSQCFDDLLQRSVFRPLGSCSGDKDLQYRMPGLSYRFAQILASKVFLRIDEGATNLSPGEYTRHMSFARKKVDDDMTKHLGRCEGLRTFLLPHQGIPIQRPVDPFLFQKHERLRLLDLSHTIFMEPQPNKGPSKRREIQNFCPSKLLSSASHFKHLRYLDLSGSRQLQTWPKPINRLRALQVLKLEHCPELKELPADLCELVRLTHLYVNMKNILIVPPSLGKLTKLEVLSSYKVQKEQAKVSELGPIEHLREICIYGVNEICEQEEAIKNKVLKKKPLERLTLEWGDNNTTHHSAVPREVLEGLEPSDDLEDLTVRNYIGKRFPAWFSFDSKKIASIRLQNCKYCEALPSLGQLPLLKTLVLQSFEKLIRVDRHFCGTGVGERFKSLQSLEFRDMNKLSCWTELAGNMSGLKSLKIKDCPSLLELPSLKHQGSLVNLVIDSAPRLESLPELPSSLNGENAQFTLANCPVVKEKCQEGGGSWEKIKDIKFMTLI